MSGKDRPGPIDVHKVAVAALTSRWQRSFPGIVTAEAAADGRVQVQPALRIPSASGQQTTPKPVTIPVGWSGWDDVDFQGVLKVGDEVLVVCVDTNWLVWLVTGGVADNLGVGGKQSGYAIAIPMQMSQPKRAPPMPAADKIRIGTRDGNTTIIFGVDGSVSVQSSSVSLGLAASPKLAVARDTDPANTNASFTLWRTNVEAGILAALGPVVPPLVGAAVGTIAATSTEVDSS